jgi:Ca-activated chloride channel family protein
MHGAKIANAKEAILQGIRTLREGDRFAVVAYDDDVTLVVPAAQATPEARDAAIAAVERIASRGSTDLHGGWQRGCEQVEEGLSKDAVGRCLLLTDGLANRGVTDPDEIVRQCAAWRDKRVVTTAFGVGADFDETLLRRMADAGGGNFQFIESAAQIADFVASEVGEALATTVREAVLVVDAGEGAVVQSLKPVLSVTFPQGPVGATRDVVLHVEDQGDALGRPSDSARFTWAGHAENDAQPRDRALDRMVASLYAARAERDALEQNQKRNFAGVRQLIERCVARIKKYAGDDAEILRIVADLERKAVQYGRDMDKLSSKAFYSSSHRIMKGRESRMALGTASVEEALRRVIGMLAAAYPELCTGLDVDALPGQLAHTEVRGCLFDPSRSVVGLIELRLQAPDLCPECRARLKAAGLTRERLQRIVKALQLLAAPSGVVH